MAGPASAGHTFGMDIKDTAATPEDRSEAPHKLADYIERVPGFDERDETIRLLNEALSLALTELDLADAA